MIEKIVSGGQTGVDRAALDAAIKLGIPHGGWCPKGRRAELNTTIPPKYDLKETESDEFSERTILNIKESDGTLIIVPDKSADIKDGTKLTINEVKEQMRPYLIVNLDDNPHIESINQWIEKNNIKVLNIAGPRESISPGIYAKSYSYCERVFKLLFSNNINYSNNDDEYSENISYHSSKKF